jgi:competence protein ComEA
MLKTILAACVATLLSVGAMAQTPAPAPAAPAAKAVAAPRPAVPAGTKVNLNTASAAELDALPSVGKARAKAIMDERAKSPFKDWADFDKRMQHSSVNRGVKAKIKDSVTF